jgi:hypothetical protein
MGNLRIHTSGGSGASNREWNSVNSSSGDIRTSAGTSSRTYVPIPPGEGEYI